MYKRAFPVCRDAEANTLHLSAPSIHLNNGLVLIMQPAQGLKLNLSHVSLQIPAADLPPQDLAVDRTGIPRKHD